MRIDKDGAMTSEERFKRYAGMPSCPVALEGDKLDNRDCTSNSETIIESRKLDDDCEGEIKGKEEFVSVKTDAK
jgi:hypothetical protein